MQKNIFKSMIIPSIKIIDKHRRIHIIINGHSQMDKITYISRKNKD